MEFTEQTEYNELLILFTYDDVALDFEQIFFKIKAKNAGIALAIASIFNEELEKF